MNATKLNHNSLQTFDELPKDWTITNLGEALPILYGKSLTEAKRDNTGSHPVYGSSGVVGKHIQPLTKGPALIVGRKGTVGAVHYSPKPCWPIDTVYYAEAREGVNLLFFHYLLKGLMLEKLDKSTAVPGLSRDDYNAVEVAIAPIGQQERIVQEIEKQFSRLDEAVTNLKRVKANLKRYKSAALKAAVEGKLTEEWRKGHHDVEPASKFLDRILAERRGEWERQLAKGHKRKYVEPQPPNISNLPELPKGWTWTSVDQLMLNVTDGDHQPPPQKNEGVPFLVIGNVRNGTLDFSETRFVSRDYYDSIDIMRKPFHHDLLYTLVGSYGICVPIDTDREFCIQRHMAILRPHSASPRKYMRHALNAGIVYQQARTVATGTAQKTVPLAGLRAIAVPLPPFAEQQRIVAEVEQRLSIVEELDAEVTTNLQRAERLRSSILSSAFRGGLMEA
jgi:type I restriction enzyme S subunit